MDPNENEAICTFDTLYTNNHIQILKVLLPYFDPNSQKRLAILIKFMELRYTMEYFGRQLAAGNVFRSGQQPDIVGIFEQIKNFCTPSERAMFDQLANMKKSMEMYEEMMKMMQLFSQIMPESDADTDAPDSSRTESADAPQSASPFGQMGPMDMLKGMLSPEQQAMFDLFTSSLGTPEQSSDASASEQK